MPKPIVAIAGQIEAVAESFAIKRRYVAFLQKAGANCLVIPTSSSKEDIEQLLPRIDGVLLPGGNNIDPARYSQKPENPDVASVKERDEFEAMLLAYAIGQDLPLLGICRGLQILNVSLGGTLSQKLEGPVSHWQEQPGDIPTHMVDVVGKTPLARITGLSRMRVNSFHHQGILELASPLEPMAFSEDGLIEAAYHPGKRFVLAMQWHPEFMPGAIESQRLATAFIDACSSSARSEFRPL